MSPSGELIHAYSDMKATDHVTETLTAVKIRREMERDFAPAAAQIAAQ